METSKRTKQATRLDLLHLVQNFFLQIHGTAMGPKNACSYADLAMGEIDLRAKFSRPIKPSLWWRYRDDVFDLWRQGLPILHQFTLILCTLPLNLS